jgi:hypothetical protein
MARTCRRRRATQSYLCRLDSMDMLYRRPGCFGKSPSRQGRPVEADRPEMNRVTTDYPGALEEEMVSSETAMRGERNRKSVTPRSTPRGITMPQFPFTQADALTHGRFAQQVIGALLSQTHPEAVGCMPLLARRLLIVIKDPGDDESVHSMFLGQLANRLSSRVSAADHLEQLHLGSPVHLGQGGKPRHRPVSMWGPNQTIK